MNPVVLIFPDLETLSNFLLENKPSNVEVNSKEQSITSVLSDEDIIIAETEYNALQIYPVKKNIDN